MGMQEPELLEQLYTTTGRLSKIADMRLSEAVQVLCHFPPVRQRGGLVIAHVHAATFSCWPRSRKHHHFLQRSQFITLHMRKPHVL